ncbi:DcaP family trimeric outer membrane transporter [Carboxylicivirga sp. RSCT41]|uniref:DcaP family trimeric outer membrane transporter n=1 Tax=Carboxylicivirga agarovorans TaxID=3417570 RepID=UPI003D354B39
MKKSSILFVTFVLALISINQKHLLAQGSLARPAKEVFTDTLVTSKVQIKLGGQLKANGIYDFNALQDSESFNILSIPTGDNQNTSPRYSLGVKQSRLNMNIAYDSKKLGRITSYFEGDFFGMGNLNFRMRFFYLDIQNFRIGQAWSLFCDETAWPDVIDFDGPPTGIWVRSAQARYTKQLSENNRIAFAVESPQAEITPIESLDSTITETFQGFPDITAHWNNTGEWGHVQLAFVLRQLNYLKNNKTLSNTGYGLSLSGHLKVRQNDKLILQAAGGKGIASYFVSFMGGGYDAVTSSRGKLSNIPVFGGYAAYEIMFGKSLKSTLVYGYTHMITEVDVLPHDEFRGHYTSGNLFWLLDDKITIGIECLYGKVNDFYGESGHATRIQSMLLFNF